ncbi:MAG: relaxase domain-containing protein, partial [Cyanobacteria bacterium CAN_BIN43]|nr:relaxase domain-containing protein [Cyanobacteria bacterium CAN_BIN43]
AKTYYKKENYYSQEDAEVNSQWQGKGADKYQLSGAITDLEAYENIVNGLSPDGKTQLRQKQNHEGKKERAGIDLTFSAPKSVSIACLVGGDTRLEAAHRIAVSRTIDLIESRYATTRINKQPVQTDNLIVAKWHHDTSRELDPHLHTHCLVMNCTQAADGKWRSISNKPFYQNKILLGQIYRNELALECRKLGYEIEPHPKELFEIKGYTRAQIEGFSKRHEQIKNKLEEIGAEPTTENKIWAWRKTRAKKNHEIGRDEKLPYWHEEADLYGIIHPDKAQVVEPTSNEQDEQIAAEIKLAVDVAIEHCSERQVAFTGEDIEKFVIAEVKPFSIHQLEGAIATHPELIKTYDGRRRYTTQTALARELATIKLMQQGKGLCSAIATNETIDSHLADKSLTSGQREAIALTATSTDQFIAWQGVAGAGKTYVLNELKQLIQVLQEVTELGEITLLAGYAPSKEATKVLGKEVGIETNTVASLLLSKQPQEHQPNQLWIVDEAGMLSAKDGYALLQRATAVGARVILVGDTRQLSAVEAGNPFKSLQQAGISTAHLNQSLRQKVPSLQHAASLAAAGNHADALQHLEAVGRLTEIPDLDERNKLIASDYLQLSPDQRQSTLVLVGTHKEKAALMQHIREGLKEEGTLVGDEAILTRLKRKDLTKVQSRYQHHYNIGDVVIPLREYKRAGLHKDRAYAVCGIDADKLILSDWSGNQVAVDPMKFRKTVYTQQEIAICVGDGLRWIKEDKQSGRGNRDEFTVMAIEGRTATIRYLNGKEESLYLDQPLPLDYAIASTTYSSQGKTADRVLVSSTCDATVSSESVYVAISRAKYDLRIYAENVDFLLEQAQESKAQKTVLELLQPSSKVQVAAAEARAVTSSVERSVGVTSTPKVNFEKESPVTNIERPLKRQDQQVAKSTPSPTLKPQSPKQLEVFWQPTSAKEAPPHIETKHWQELVKDSAIHPDIAAANFRSLQMGSIEQEHESWEYLMYSHKLERTNIGQLTTGMLKRYAHIDAGGWWCNSGVNALSFSNLEAGNEPQEKIWGCYKPNEPRSNPDKPGKVIKYEHPPKVDLGIFLLHVPDELAQKISAKAGIEPTSEDRQRGFWYCAWKYNLPITLAEGAKKAASLLSQGHVAIGLPGIYAGYRSKDEQGRPIKAHLHEELAVFATLGRDISFCFDYETRPETKRNIEIAISRTGSLLQQQGAKVSVVSLPGPEKGVDDLIVVHSPLAYEQLASVALPLRQWREHNKQSRHLAIVPPKKLSVQERKEQLKEPPLGQHPINNPNLNQLQEPDHDSQQRQINREYSADGHPSIDQSLSPIDQKDRPVGENWHSTYEQQQSIERTNPAPGNYPDREPERIESQSPELLEAISRHLELQTVEQLGADITELSRSLANSWLRGQGAANFTSSLDRQDPTIIDRTAGNESIDGRGGDDGRVSGQLIEVMPGTAGAAIANHLSVETIASRVVAQDLHNLCQDFLGNQSQLLSEVMRKLESALPHELLQSSSEVAPSVVAQSQAARAISNYLTARTLTEAPLTQEFLPLSQQLKGLQHQGLTNAIHQLTKVIEEATLSQPKVQLDQEQLNEQSIQSVVRHTQLEEVALPLLQPLTNLTQQLGDEQSQSFESLKVLDTVISDYLAQTQATVAALKQKTNQQALLAASNRAIHEALASALVTTVSPLIGELSQHRQQLAEGKTALNSLEQLLDRLTADHTISTVAGYIERASVTNCEGIATALENLTTDLQREQANSLSALRQLEVVISSYLEQTKARKARQEQQIVTGIGSALSKHIEQSAVETLPLVEALTDLTQQLKSSSAHAAETINQLDDVISGYLQQIEPLLKEKQQQITNTAIASISQQINLSAIGSTTAISACKQIGEDLSMLQTASNTQALKKVHAVIAKHTKETVITLAQQLRYLPLDDIVPRLGLIQDKHDKHKWRGKGQIISINDQKFYDHFNLTGGYGAIDLVMHVQARDFKAALGWLADSALELPFVPVRAPQPKVLERQSFQPPAPDESKWLAVRQYLVEKRQLPVALVDQLHAQGKVYADAEQNAVFLRQDVDGNFTGASLRGTYKDSAFKGLATGSQRAGGWFSFVQGEGQLEQIVLVESAIDALSAAALAEQPGKAMFISTDGTGSVPVGWLRQQQQGVEIVAAHDSDRAGEEMAWRLATELGSVTRATPTFGKDWNEQLKSDYAKRSTVGDRQPGRIEPQPDVSQWKLVAQAIGKPDAYLGRIEAVIASGQGLSTEARAAMRQDFDTYKQTASNLWQWHQSAKDIGKPDAYLGRIAEVAIAFHHPKKPTPLSAEAIATMQQDLAQYEQLSTSSLWQHYSRNTDITRPMRTDLVVAHTAAKDSSNPQQERLNTRALKLSIRLLSEFAKNQCSDCASWTGGWYTFTKVGSDIKIGCSQRQSTILELTNGDLQGSITQRDVEKFEKVLEAIKEKEIGRQPEL